MAIIVAVMLKYFLIEAYKIPTGSMQPTLMGNQDTGIFDRVLVDKLSYHYRAPKRFEVAVFKYPLDRSMNYIKRIVGVGPEWLRIHNGDLWRSDRPQNDPPRYESDWEILRRPKNVQADTWKALDEGAPGRLQWRRVETALTWELSEDRIVAKGGGTLRLPYSSSFMDDFHDGYPQEVRDRLQVRRGIRSATKPVGDLRFEAKITAEDACQGVQLDLFEGTRIYSFKLPGPAAPEDQTAEILASDRSRSARSPLSRDREIKLEEPWRLPAGDSVELAVQNLDDRLAVEIDGDEVLSLEIPAATDQTSYLHLSVVGGEVEFDDVEVYRDIYYLSDQVKVHRWYVEEDHYVMLGDNTQDSSDSREWTLARYHLPGVEGTVEGNYRGEEENPQRVPGGEQGTMFFFRDEWGTLHSSLDSERKNAVPTNQLRSQVSKEMITGRALIVFWPLKPSLKLWRLKWIR
jgi:signal peptidase I